jgi:hypothetical protein
MLKNVHIDIKQHQQIKCDTWVDVIVGQVPD